MKYETILVTNQAGIGRKFFKEEDLNEVHNYMCDHVRKFGGSINYIYFVLIIGLIIAFVENPSGFIFEGSI